MLTFSDAQTARIETALVAFAIANGADESDLETSRVRLGGRDALIQHVAKVERTHGVTFGALTANTQNILEQAAATAGALAHTVEFFEFGELDARVWDVVRSAR